MSGQEQNAPKEGLASRRPLRAIGYVRVSTGGQAERGMGLETQRRSVRDFARSEPYELLEVVSEAASGAAKAGELFSLEHRPVLEELVQRGERHEYDVLLVATLDRLSRDQVEQLYLKRLLARFGVTVVSAGGETNGNGDAISELVERLIGAVHDFDRKRILERLRAGKAEKKRLGRHVHGSVPYGYRSAGQGRLEVDEQFAEVVRTIFRLAAKEGLGSRRIARRLNEAGVQSPKGTTWSPPVVAHILKNPVYRGERYGVKRAQPVIVTARLWNAAQR
jgi:site-specific DNA recombinase